MKNEINCSDISSHFNSLWKWDMKDYKTDGFKAGKPEKMTDKIGVMWKPKLSCLKEAYSDGCSFIVCHESVAVKTRNDSKEPEASFALPEENEKFRFIEENDITIYRCHDLWDRMADIGVRDTWRSQLFPDSPVFCDQYPYYVTQIAPTSLESLARHIISKTSPLGQNGVLVSGDLKKKVGKIATGTGVCTDTALMRKLGADAAIITDDYYLYVRQGILSEEMDFPTIAVNHNVTEESAIKNLALHLSSVFPDINIRYYPQICPYKVVT